MLKDPFTNLRSQLGISSWRKTEVVSVHRILVEITNGIHLQKECQPVVLK